MLWISPVAILCWVLHVFICTFIITLCVLGLIIIFPQVYCISKHSADLLRLFFLYSVKMSQYLCTQILCVLTKMSEFSQPFPSEEFWLCLSVWKPYLLAADYSNDSSHYFKMPLHLLRRKLVCSLCVKYVFCFSLVWIFTNLTWFVFF